MSEAAAAVLLAAAEPQVSARYAALLEGLGYRVLRAAEAAEAERLAAGEGPGLVLLDLELPGLGKGLEGAARIARRAGGELVLITHPGLPRELLRASSELAPRGYLGREAPEAIAEAVISAALRSLRRDRELSDREARLRAATRALPDLMLVLDEEGRYLEVLTSNEELLYRPAEEMLGRTIGELFEPELARPFQELIRGAARGEAPRPFEYSIPTPAGERRFEGRTAPFGRGEDGKALVVFIARDVTERRRAEEEARRAVAEKDILLRELQHRVKNNLAMMASLFSLEAARLGREEDRAVFANAEDRLRAMAFVYDKLYGEGRVEALDMGPYVEELSRELAASYASYSPALAGPRLEISAEHALLDLRRAVPLGLSLTELLTNAYKYGFPEGGEGRIAVTFGREGGEQVLAVEDDGAPLPEGFDPIQAEGTGTKLVAILAEQIRGRLSWGPAREPGPGGRAGARFELRFPADPAA